MKWNRAWKVAIVGDALYPDNIIAEYRMSSIIILATCMISPVQWLYVTYNISTSKKVTQYNTNYSTYILRRIKTTIQKTIVT